MSKRAITGTPPQTELRNTRGTLQTLVHEWNEVQDGRAGAGHADQRLASSPYVHTGKRDIPTHFPKNCHNYVLTSSRPPWPASPPGAPAPRRPRLPRAPASLPPPPAPLPPQLSALPAPPRSTRRRRPPLGPGGAGGVHRPTWCGADIFNRQEWAADPSMPWSFFTPQERSSTPTETRNHVPHSTAMPRRENKPWKNNVGREGPAVAP